MKHYEFDFEKAAGTTTAEKYSSLLSFIKEINLKQPVRMIIGGVQLMTTLHDTAFHNKAFVPAVRTCIGHLEFIGIISGQDTDIKCFLSDHIDPYELVLFNEQCNFVIEIIYNEPPE